MIKRNVAVPLLVIVFLISSFGTYFALSNRKLKTEDKTEVQEEQKEEIDYSALDINSPDGYNMVLLGYGGEGHDGGYLTDVIILIHVDSEDKKVTLISIPRDLWVSIPIRSDISENFKINAAYAIGMDDKGYPLKEPQYKGSSGGGTMIKKVLGDVTGLKISNYIAVDFESFKNIIDKLGGVTVDVPVTFNDYFYPVKGLENETCGFSASKIADLHSKYSDFDLEKQFECRYEHLHFDQGKVEMDGETALKFVRSRHSSEDGGDFARSRRQRAVLTAVESKLLSLSAVKSYDDIFQEFRNMITTDIDTSFIKSIAKVFEAPNDYEARFSSVSDENVLVNTRSLNGQFILVPKDGEDVFVGVQNFIYDAIQK